MPNMKQSWWTRMPLTDLAEMQSMMRDPSISYKDIARTYGREFAADISLYAKKIGLPPRPCSLRAVEAELVALVAQQEELKRKTEALKARRAELQVRFEWDGGVVSVHGVGEEPLRAQAESWINFLNVEGGRRLREFIVVESKKRA